MKWPLRHFLREATSNHDEVIDHAKTPYLMFLLFNNSQYTKSLYGCNNRIYTFEHFELNVILLSFQNKQASVREYLRIRIRIGQSIFS